MGQQEKGSQHMPTAAYDTTDISEIHLAAIRLVNRVGPAGVTIAGIADDAGMSEAAVTTQYATVPDVFRAVVASLNSALDLEMDASIARRRSLTTSMQIALGTFWRDVEARRNEHQAAKLILIYQLNRRDAVVPDGPLFEVFINTVEQWLEVMADVHDVVWEVPARQLAQLMMATLDGISTNYLFLGNADEARQLLDLFAFQIAQHGRRKHKNQPH
jgi:AcrR family transcriptional regulator